MSDNFPSGYDPDREWRMDQDRRDLKCPGVSRDKDSITSLVFHFSRPITNAEMEFLHEVMQRSAACMPAFHEINKQGSRP